MERFIFVSTYHDCETFEYEEYATKCDNEAREIQKDLKSMTIFKQEPELDRIFALSLKEVKSLDSNASAKDKMYHGC